VERGLASLTDNIEERKWTHTWQSSSSPTATRQPASVLELKGTVDGWNLGRVGTQAPWRGRRRGVLARVSVSRQEKVRGLQVPEQREAGPRTPASRGAGSEAGARERGGATGGISPPLLLVP
ncbi:hypothetical protein P7K49_016736, partial [Saguinus oedipus]